MEQGRTDVGQGPQQVPEEIGAGWAEFIQQQIQSVFQAALPHLVQQISERAAASSTQASPFATNQGGDRELQRVSKFEDGRSGEREWRVAKPEKFTGKRGGEIYRWLAQIRLVFRANPRTYQHDEDKVAYAVSYLGGAAQSWAMPLLQALDEGRRHDLLLDYNAFREAIISVYGDINRRGTAEDCLAKIKQTGSVAAYISSFNEHSAQVDWNESSLVARFRAGLKDEVLDSIATAETQPRGLNEWMAMSSRIDERLWTRRQSRRSQTSYTTPRSPTFASRDSHGRFPPTQESPVPMELDAARVTTALAKTAIERLDYQRQGKCRGCGQVGHVRSKCPTNPSRPLNLAALETRETDRGETGKGVARD